MHSQRKDPKKALLKFKQPRTKETRKRVRYNVKYTDVIRRPPDVYIIGSNVTTAEFSTKKIANRAVSCFL